MAKLTGAERGWIFGIGGFAVVHNVIAAGRRREMLCGAVRRHRRAHPVVVPVLWGWLYLHLMGWLPREVDPLYQLGVATEWTAELVRRWRGQRGVGTRV